MATQSTTGFMELMAPVSFLCFLFFYLSLATFAFALMETIIGIVSKDDNSLSWWRRSRLVALTYAQMYLSQHFLQTLASERNGTLQVEKGFWMASQSIALGVLLFSTVKVPRGKDRLLLGTWYSFETPQTAQVILTLVVAFNISLVAGPLAGVCAVCGLLISLDWRLLFLLFEGIAIFKAWNRNFEAELAWVILHLVLAVGCIKAVHEVDKHEGLISLPDDEEMASGINEKLVDDVTEISENSEALSASFTFLRFCVLFVFAGAIIMATFDGLERLLLPTLLASKDGLGAEGLVLSHIFTMDLIGVILVLTLTFREIYHNDYIKLLCTKLCY